jgi:hypothetical protein
MTRKTDPDLLIRILDTYTSGITNSLQTVASMNGVSFASVYTWLKDPEIIIPEYMGEINIPFGKAMNLARNVAKAITISRSLEDRVLNGLRVQIVHHGAFLYVDDEAAIRATDEDFKWGVEAGIFWPDKKMRDKAGNRIVATKIEAPPAQLVEVYARANMPAVYGNKNEVTVKGNVGIAVSTIGAQRPLPVQFQTPPPPPQLEAVTETASDDGEVYSEAASLDELLGVEPATDTPPDVYVDAAPEPIAPPPIEPDPVMIREPTPAAYAPTPSPIPAGWRNEWLALQAKQRRA